MIKLLKPYPGAYEPPPKTPACETLIQTTNHERHWRERRGQKEPFTCSRDSVVEIDGKHYCRMHGGHVVLDLYLKGKLILRSVHPER